MKKIPRVCVFLIFITLTTFGDVAVAEESVVGNVSVPGTLTYDFVNWISHETEAIVDTRLAQPQVHRAATGRFGWRHPEGHLIRTQGCGRYVNRLVVDWADGKTDIVSPCSSEIKTVALGKPQFGVSQISPDGKHVAAELKYYHNSQWWYSVVVLSEGSIVAHFDNHAAPTWTPDGRLIFVGNGLFVTNIEGSPERIDDGWLGIGVNNPDVSPDGKLLVFEYNERLWVMDTGGKEHMELVSGPAQYRFPVWSPDGHYVAFLTVTGSSHSEVDRGLHLLDVRKGELSRIDISRFGGPLNHVPYGPLSWNL